MYIMKIGTCLVFLTMKWLGGVVFLSYHKNKRKNNRAINTRNRIKNRGQINWLFQDNFLCSVLMSTYTWLYPKIN